MDQWFTVASCFCLVTMFFISFELGSLFVMHICLHHLSACAVGEICVSWHGCKPSGMGVSDRVRHVRYLHLRALTHLRSDTEIPHKPFFESVQWCHFILMNINHMNNALSWIECNGILSVKEMALLIQSFARIRGSFNFTKLTPANHRTYQGDVGPWSDCWEGFYKGQG